MEIMGKDLHKHIGKSILTPNPLDPNDLMPQIGKILSLENKKVVIGYEALGATYTQNFSKDKTKYRVYEAKSQKEGADNIPT